MSEKPAGFDNSKQYTEEDMLCSFLHGREFDRIPDVRGCEPPANTPEINLPFWDWLKRRNGARL